MLVDQERYHGVCVCFVAVGAGVVGGGFVGLGALVAAGWLSELELEVVLGLSPLAGLPLLPLLLLLLLRSDLDLPCLDERELVFGYEDKEEVAGSLVSAISSLLPPCCWAGGSTKPRVGGGLNRFCAFLAEPEPDGES